MKTIYFIQSTLYIMSVLVPSYLWRWSESAVVMISCYFDLKMSKCRTNVPRSYPGLPYPHPLLLTLINRLKHIARSKACPLGMQTTVSSIPTSDTFFHGDLVMKKFLRPFSLFSWLKKNSCQLLAKECALSTGKLPRRLAQEQSG